MRRTTTLMLVGVGALVVGGCVTTEKYEAEKARALNFQRLLAQEEKRTGELDTELKRVKREQEDLEAQNRELIAKVNAAREQMGRLEEELNALRETAELREREMMTQPGKSRRKGKAAAAPMPVPVPLGGEGAIYHEVQPGETLFRLSRLYGVSVDQIKQWNGLQDNRIDVGQHLIVGQQ